MVLYYPWIGLLLGVLIAAVGLPLGAVDPGVGAAIILILWVWSTGALHLDGLADTADAWIGGMGSRERTLEIMKDPRSGPAAITTLLLVLIAKWAGLHALLIADHIGLVLLVPLLARAALPMLMLLTPYARPQGIASDQIAHLPRRSAWASILAALLLAPLLAGWVGLVLGLATLVLFWSARRALLARLGGFTGDTAGALVELTETLLLLLLAVLIGAPD